MALSEREQQVLRDLEEQLHHNDPSLASTIAEGERRLGRPSPRHIGAGAALVLLGFAVVIVGVSLSHGLVSILVGLAGFALAVWGVTLMLTRVDGGAAGASRRSSRGGPRGSAKRHGSFMDRQSERWDRRRDSER